MELKIRSEFNNTVVGGIKNEKKDVRNTIQKYFENSTTSTEEAEQESNKNNIEYSTINEQYNRLYKGGSFTSSGIVTLKDDFFGPEGYVQNGIINGEDRNYNPDDYLVPYYDKNSCQTFMVSRLPTGTTMIPNETMDKLKECYPNENELWFRVSEIHGNAREINGVPVYIFTDIATGEKQINVMDKDFRTIKAVYNVGNLDNEYLFDFMEKFSKTYNMNNGDFWDKLIDALSETDEFKNVNGEDYIIRKAVGEKAWTGLNEYNF